MSDVFFYCQHLLGTGHFRRSVALCNAMSASGITVTLASGGMPVDNSGLVDVEFEQLPPARASHGDFSDLLDERDQPVDSLWWATRAARLLDVWRKARAPVLITESYPFARRQMRHELLRLLEATRQADFAVTVASSVRDILQPKTRPSRLTETVDLINHYYHWILVHADPAVATLDETFAKAGLIASKIVYTGYVDTEAADTRGIAGQSTFTEGDKKGIDVLVSAGGGAVGRMLFNTSLQAATKSPSVSWHLLVGHNLPDPEFSQLQSIAGANVVVERNRPDFRQLLQSAEVSVSQAGYNTVVDVLRTGVKPVLVPFAQSGEVEQKIRAEKMSDSGLAVVLNESRLTASALLAAIDQAGNLPPCDVAIDTSGAQFSARLIGDWLGEIPRTGSS